MVVGTTGRCTKVEGTCAWGTGAGFGHDGRMQEGGRKKEEGRGRKGNMLLSASGCPLTGMDFPTSNSTTANTLEPTHTRHRCWVVTTATLTTARVPMTTAKSEASNLRLRGSQAALVAPRDGSPNSRSFKARYRRCTHVHSELGHWVRVTPYLCRQMHMVRGAHTKRSAILQIKRREHAKTKTELQHRQEHTHTHTHTINHTHKHNNNNNATNQHNDTHVHNPRYWVTMHTHKPAPSPCNSQGTCAEKRTGSRGRLSTQHPGPLE